MKIESFRQVQAGRTDELRLAFLELLSEPKKLLLKHEISLKYDEFILNVISSIITDWGYL